MRIDFVSLLFGLTGLTLGILYFFFPEAMSPSGESQTIGYPQLINDLFENFGGWLPGIIFISGGLILLNSSISKKENGKSKVVINDRPYSKSAYNFILKNKISFELIENAISHGDSIAGAKKTRYRWTDKNGLTVIVFVNEHGDVLEVVI